MTQLQKTKERLKLIEAAEGPHKCNFTKIGALTEDSPDLTTVPGRL